MDLDEIATKFEEGKEKETSVSVMEETNALPETNFGVDTAISGVKHKIVEKAVEKINDDNIIKKHSDTIAKISDRALEVEAEKQRLVVEAVNADNKVVEQEIKNRLIVLNAEAIRLKAEQKQLDKEQKAEHKARNKDAKWKIYGAKLTKLKYDYVPCSFVLAMLLFFDGVKAFFDGIGAVSTSLMKAIKWVVIIVLIIGVLLSVPLTREWILTILKFKK